MSGDTKPWSHDPDHSLVRGDTAVTVLLSLGVLTEAEAQRVRSRLLSCHEQAAEAMPAKGVR